MGCGAVTSAKYLPKPAVTDAKPSSKSSASNVPAPTLAPETISGTDSSDPKTDPLAAQADDVRGSPKRSRVGKAVRSAQKWSRAEVEQLSVAQLCRWLEALERDCSSAVNRDKAVARLWQETLSWLAYFGADAEVADKETLVQLLLANEEELPPPAFLGESAEDAYLTQVQRHVGLVKDAATGLLRELANEIMELETQQRKEEKESGYEHPWTENGKVLAPFGKSEIQTFSPDAGSEADANSDTERHFLQVTLNERVDVMFHDPSGWAWCTASARRASSSGWVPSGSLVEVARVLESHSSSDNDGTLSIEKGQELEVLLRHYSGWTLARHASSPNKAGAEESKSQEGWVPDACLTDHPRSLKTKQHRLILNGLHRLAEDAYGVEASFFKLRTRVEGNEELDDGEEPALSTLYAQVLALIEEYRSICEVVQAHAASGLIGGETHRNSEVADSEATERSKEPGSIPGLPDWIYLGAHCLWNSKSQGWMMPVTVRKISEQRQKVLVVFDDAPTSCKHVPFSAFADMSTCLLQPASKENSRKRKRRRKSERERRRKQKSEVLAVEEAAEEALVDDLKGLVNDLEDMQSAQGTARKHLLSDSSDSSDGEDRHSVGASSTTTAVSASRPESGDTVEASVPSGQHSARFGSSAGQPAAAAAKAGTEPAPDVVGLEEEDEDEAAAAKRELTCEEATLQIQKNVRAQRGRSNAVARLAAQACKHYIAVAEEALEEIRRSRAAAEAAKEAQRQEAERRGAAAVKIQSVYRGHEQRARAAAEAEAAAAAAAAAAEAGRRAAVREMQTAARTWLCRRELAQLHRRHTAVTSIQRQIYTWAPRALLAEFRAEWNEERTAAAIHIERMARGWHARREVRRRRAEREEALKVANEASAMCKIQGACKGFLIRVMMHDLQLKWTSAARIQARARGCIARNRYGAELAEFTSRRITAAVVIQAAWRGLRARRFVAERRRVCTSAVVKVQCAWRSYRARQTLARLREERAAEEARRRREALESAAAVRAQAAWRGLRTRRRTSAILENRQRAAVVIQSRSRKFLAWREARRFDASRLAASVTRDRALAALAAAHARAELRAKAVRLGQAGAGTAVSLLRQGAAGAGIDAAMMASLTVDEGLLARLAVSDAVAEVASMVRTAWELTVGAGPGGSSAGAARSAGMPAPLPVLQSSLTALVRRLTPEAGPTDTATRQPREALAQEAASAEEHVRKLREATLAPLRVELEAISNEGPAIVKAAKEVMAKVPIEVQALLAKHESQTEQAASDLRAERERKHEQTCALHNIALQTQIQKERLETSLMDSSKGPRVYDSVHANVKKLQEKLRDLEVSGTSNRKNQGILGHTLRILEVRANKAAGERRTADTLHAQRAEDYIGDYKESEQVRKKRLRQEEQDRAFYKALETELATLRADREAKAAWEASALGAKLRAEAEVLGKTAAEIADRSKQWRQAASDARPWLGALLPLARSNVAVSGLTDWLKSQSSSEDALASAVAGALSPMEALRREAKQAGPADSPRETKVAAIAASLAEVRAEVGKLRVAYPDPIGPPPGASTEAGAHGLSASPLSDQNEFSPEASPDRDDEEDAVKTAQHSRQPRAKRAATSGMLEDECATPRLDEASPEARPETVWEEPQPAPAQPKKRTNKIMEQAAAGLASLGHELNGLSETLATATPARPKSAGGRRKSHQPPGIAFVNSTEKVSTPARRPPSAAAVRRSPPAGAPAGNALSAVKESRRTHTAWS